MLKRHVETRRLADLQLLSLNARYMTHEQYARLVENVRGDGCLTSVPLVYEHRGRAGYDEMPAGAEVLSGNHRVQAAVEALGGDAESEVMVIDEPLTRQQRIAIQLSHNSIAGQDDPATLKQLYDELDSVDWRAYSGLDDKALELLEQVDLSSLSEANLDFMTAMLVFLPAEHDQAEKLLDEARRLADADREWLADLRDHDATLDALATAQAAHNVSNVATALRVVLAVFERHLGELAEGWYDPEAGLSTRAGAAPLETVFGCREMPTEAAAVVRRALDRMAGRGDINPAHRWQALELWAADYLASP